ncbi:MAG: LamG domain-containing protein, partial [Fuerstiella sp.]|nr:LamG domain-containing protein [Fuerstiella sp.]
AAVRSQLESAQAAWEQTAGSQSDTSPAALEHLPLDQSNVGVEADRTVQFTDGVIDGAAAFDGNGCIRIHQSSIEFKRRQPFTISAWVYPESAGCVISKTDSVRELRGFDITLRKGKVAINLIHRWKRNAIQVTSQSSIAMRQWSHLTVSYDGSSGAKGVRVFLNGTALPIVVSL